MRSSLFGLVLVSLASVAGCTNAPDPGAETSSKHAEPSVAAATTTTATAKPVKPLNMFRYSVAMNGAPRYDRFDDASLQGIADEACDRMAQRPGVWPQDVAIDYIRSISSPPPGITLADFENESIMVYVAADKWICPNR